MGRHVGVLQDAHLRRSSLSQSAAALIVLFRTLEALAGMLAARAQALGARNPSSRLIVGLRSPQSLLGCTTMIGSLQCRRASRRSCVAMLADGTSLGNLEIVLIVNELVGRDPAAGRRA